MTDLKITFGDILLGPYPHQYITKISEEPLDSIDHTALRLYYPYWYKIAGASSGRQDIHAHLDYHIRISAQTEFKMYEALMVLYDQYHGITKKILDLPPGKRYLKQIWEGQDWIVEIDIISSEELFHISEELDSKIREAIVLYDPARLI